MSAVLTNHARDQIYRRGVATSGEVLTAVNEYEHEIRTSGDWEVKVVVKPLKAYVYLPDGSNGDVVVACIDPRRTKVKTVMLQRKGQVEHKSKYLGEKYLGLEKLGLEAANG